MKIFWLVFSLIILFILFCPFSLKLVYQDEVSLKIGYIFPIIKILPKKPKKEKKSEKEKKTSDKKSEDSEKEEKSSGEKKKKSKNPVWEFTKKNGLDGLIELLKEIVGIVVRLVDTIRRHITVSKLRLDLLITGNDPADTAMKYGYACSAIYPLLSILDQHVRIKKHDVYIDAGFNAQKTQIRFILKARIMPIFVIIGAVVALIKGLKIFMKIKQ